MLHDAGEQAVDIKVHGLALERPGVDHDLLRATHVHAHAGQAQAALLLHGRAARPAQHGVDEDMLFASAAAAGTVHHEQPVGQRHLVGRQADALRLIHDLEHLLDGFTEPGVEPRHRAGPPQERRVRILDERERADRGGIGGSV